MHVCVCVCVWCVCVCVCMRERWRESGGGGGGGGRGGECARVCACGVEKRDGWWVGGGGGWNLVKHLWQVRTGQLVKSNTPSIACLTSSGVPFSSFPTWLTMLCVFFWSGPICRSELGVEVNGV